MGKQKLSDMVADNILKMIQEQQYDTDGFLPSEGKLLEKFEVSRITVREAVRTLEVRGFVRRIHGKGIQVVDNAANVLTQSFNDMIVQGTIAQDDMSTLNELLEIRTILEPKCAEM
ncbi:FadR family transcriptional regulator, partial [Romboutsia ilealis]|nr:FadR family transcriptional regulator [Romboutsia ilealis]